MRLYSTLTREVEAFESPDRSVRIYVCGITPYDATHLGHALTYTFSDVLIRLLRHFGYRIQYVQNLTDIDDAILRAARERREDWKELGRRWTRYYIEDMKTLNILPPDHFPRATEHLSDMHEVIGTLLDEGVAYRAGGGVYFDIDAWGEYGKLSRLEREEMLPVADERGNDPEDPRKRDPLDFPLWKAEEAGEPSWPSPWGPGRPGWHIECSTMATRYLGETIDIHGGGRDLVFPHHEGEIAQAECASHRPFCRVWFHTAMLRHQGEKMSKSVGNLVMARDLLDDHTPDALRLYLVGHHYRESWEHNPNELEEAQVLADRLRRAVEVEGPTGAAVELDPREYEDRYWKALSDDLDSPVALDILEGLAETILQAAVGSGGPDLSAAQAALGRMGGVLGLRLNRSAPDIEVLEGWERHRHP